MGLLGTIVRRKRTIDSAWTVDASTEAPEQKKHARHEYFPVVDTLRLYAGWLLAWYFVIYAVGAYLYTRPLPFQSSIINELFLSPLILHFSFLSFLFLLLSEIHRLLKRRILVGILLGIVGVAVYVLFRANV